MPELVDEDHEHEAEREGPAVEEERVRSDGEEEAEKLREDETELHGGADDRYRARTQALERPAKRPARVDRPAVPEIVHPRGGYRRPPRAYLNARCRQAHSLRSRDPGGLRERLTKSSTASDVALPSNDDDAPLPDEIEHLHATSPNADKRPGTRILREPRRATHCGRGEAAGGADPPLAFPPELSFRRLGGRRPPRAAEGRGQPQQRGAVARAGLRDHEATLIEVGGLRDRAGAGGQPYPASRRVDLRSRRDLLRCEIDEGGRPSHAHGHRAADGRRVSNARPRRR